MKVFNLARSLDAAMAMLWSAALTRIRKIRRMWRLFCGRANGRGGGEVSSMVFPLLVVLADSNLRLTRPFALPCTR